MKRTVFVLAAAAAASVGAWLVMNVAFAQTGDGEKTITITQKQFEEYVQKRVADVLAKEKKAPVTDKEVVDAANWHKAIYSGVEYTVYTGPGQAMIIRSVPNTGKAATGPAAPGTGAAPTGTALPTRSPGKLP